VIVEGEGAVLGVSLGHLIITNRDWAATRSSQITLGGQSRVVIVRLNMTIVIACKRECMKTGSCILLLLC